MSTDYNDVNFGVKRRWWDALEREAMRQQITMTEFMGDLVSREALAILAREAIERGDEPSEAGR